MSILYKLLKWLQQHSNRLTLIWSDTSSDNTPYEKVGNADPVCIADEVPFEIPESWEWCRLSNLTVKEIKRGKSPTYISSSGVLVFAQKCNVKTGGIDMSLAKFLDEKTLGKYPTEEFMQDYDIVVNSTGTGTMGRIGLFRDSDNPGGLPIVPDSHVTIVRLNHSVSIDYLLCCLQYYQPYLEEHGEGSTNQKELKPDTIKNLYVPLPPISEQKRIADMVTGLEPYISAYGKKDARLAELNKGFPEQLKKSILQLAVQGKLVPQDPADEPANVLLKRIQAEKERLIREGKIKRDKNESVIFRRDNSHYEKHDGKEYCIDEEIPCELPDSWAWIRLISIIEGKPQNGKSYKSVDYITSTKVLTLTATTSGKFKPDAYKYVPIEVSPDSSLWLKRNDILIQRSNSRELVGTSCIYSGNDNEYIYPDLMMRIKVLPGILEEYLDLVLKSPMVRTYYIQSATGTSESMPKINQITVSQTLIPLPPSLEQARIVEEVNRLLKYVNALYG